MAMYTTCPGCNRQFQLRAGHLAAASGDVRCGYCKLKFNALKYLVDAPMQPPQTRSAALPSQGDGDPKSAAARTNKRRDGRSADDSDSVVRAYEFQLRNVAKAEHKNSSYRPLWLAGVITLSLLLVVQSLWHHRNYLYVSYHGLLSYAISLCQKLPCEPIRQQGLNNIELVNRDVRFHPQYQDTLLVNATILNNSESYMPLPLLELQVYDISGKELAWRRFSPEEYAGIEQHTQGMPPGEPIYIVLELSGNVADADGFELGFAYPQSLLFFAR